ncbi:MAG: CHAD domain-containing protein [Rhodobacter sp.]|nr:CHAD domain-containing protein [Paracoccaceae bacterium]MCC0076947.1 CHAD domain-containing protein [Rhodobacter sp.]
MAYQFTLKDPSVKAALRRIAREQIDTSLALLDAGAPLSPEALHELRKTIKKLRALLRLVRPVFPDYARENTALRDAGRLVAGLRERDVLLALFDRHAGASAPPDGLRQALADSLPDTSRAPEALADHAAALRALRDRARHWRLKAKGFDALEPGLARSHARARSALKAYRKAPGPVALHTLRKELKTQWYYTRLLAPIWPPMMEARAAQLDRIGEGLGDARDNTLLADRLSGLPGGASLTDRARDEAGRLDKQAVTDARRILAEPPAALCGCWRAWWGLRHD